MYALFGIILSIVGLVMLINPDLIYDITQSWKNSSVNVYPSDMYRLSTRIGGGFFVVGIAAVVTQFVMWLDV